MAVAITQFEIESHKPFSHSLRYYQRVGVAGGNYANMISVSWRGGAEEVIHVTLVGSGCGQE